MTNVFNESVAFILRQKGVWGHAEWEDFRNTIQHTTRTWSAVTEAYLGGVQESLKAVYAAFPALPAKISAVAVPRKSSPKSGSAKNSMQPRKKAIG